MAVALRRKTGIFHRSEAGGMTVEAVLWMPIFAVLICIIADASMIFGRKAEVLRIVQDANRAMSIGRFRETSETQDYVLARIDRIAPNAEVVTTVVEGVVRTVVTMPASDLTLDNPIGILDSITVRVSAEHMLEA
jgi:Flp pilus assembly protein TadG